ncbi:MAG: peptidoglycan glycosyltransferase [Spirochaetes bacterium]|nr:MAG: peptidoglycan glycosyltransferase [Spirochaetota bacterium]
MPAKISSFTIFLIVTSIFVLLLVWKYVDIMLISPTPATRVSGPAQITERGPILDRNGRILAIQTQMDSVTAWMPNVTDKDAAAILLADALNMDLAIIQNKFKNYTGFVYIKRKISTTESNLIKNLISTDKLPGISLEPEYGRNYPEKNLTSHITGFTGIDNTGLDGIELSYNDTLSPKSDLDEGIIYGNQLFLTIDLNIQYFAKKLATKAYNEYNASSVLILVMDAKNGDFLSWVSLPDYNPNTFGNASSKEKNNIPATYAYEPGSVFKVFSLSSELEIGGITTKSRFYAGGFYEHQFPDELVRINDLGTYGDISVANIIKYSSNAGAAYASDTVSKEDFYNKIVSFGFNSRTGIPFPGETTGILNKPENWSGRSKPTIAIGQEISVSAVQIITAATVLTNQGTLLEPHIIDRIVSPEGKLIKDFQRKPVRHVIKPEIANAMLLMMETATESGGTARRLAIEGLRISAKTGTAQKIDPESGKYSPDSFIASTLAIFPTINPQIIMYMIIDNPKGDEFYGGRIVTPIIKELTEELVRYLDIPIDSEKIIKHSGIITLNRSEMLVTGEKIPNLIGLSKRDIIPLVSIPDISVNIKGEGWVISQEPPQGTEIKKGMIINLELE